MLGKHLDLLACGVGVYCVASDAIIFKVQKFTFYYRVFRIKLNYFEDLGDHLKTTFWL